MSEFWTPSRVGNLTTAGAICALALLVCFYATKYELALLGRNPSPKWWPPREWTIYQIWRAIPEGANWKLMFWGVMMWIYGITTLILFPFVVYAVWQSLFR